MGQRMEGDGRLRVLHVGKFYPPCIGGIETHLRTLCAELKSAVDLDVVVANDGPRTMRSVVDGVNLTRLGTVLKVRSTPICPHMARSIRDARADLVHVHLPNPWAVMAYLLSGHRGSLVATWHSDIVKQKALRSAFEVFSRMFLRRCKAIIASSENYIDSSPVLSRNRDRCSVVPFGVSVMKLQRYDVNAVHAIVERFGRRIVLTVGRLVYYKGLEYLIRAMNSVDGHLLIAGDGPWRQKLETEASADPIVRRKVSFLGHVEDVVPYYHACEVFALPSVTRSEAFGIVQLEAMACGKPVVNTRLPSGVPFVSLDGVTGLTVAPRNSEEMSNALNRLLDDHELRQKYGNSAQHRVRTEFTVDAMVKRTLDIYEQVAEAGLADRGIDELVGKGAELTSAAT